MSDTQVTDDLLLEAAVDMRKLPAVNILAYSGNIMNVPGWGNTVIDLANLDTSHGVAILADHDSSCRGVVGHGDAEVRDNRLIVTGSISATGQNAKEIVEASKNGFPWQASVGVEVLERQSVRSGQQIVVNGRTIKAPPGGLTLVTKGRLREVSIVGIGCDGGTAVSIAASRTTEGNMEAQEHLDEAAIRANERERLSNIEAMCRGPQEGWGVQQRRVDELKTLAINGEITHSDLAAQMLGVVRMSRPKPVSTLLTPSVGTDVMLEAALLRRMGLDSIGEDTLGPQAMEQGAGLRATHALDICRAALQSEGLEVPTGRQELVRAALSTYALPEALGNVANKLITQEYTESPASWRSIAAIRSASNFHEHTAVRPSFTGNLTQLAPGGEIKNGSVDEAIAQFKVDTFAKMVSIDRRDLINDDLSIFDQTARAFGRAAMRNLSDLVYEVLLANAGGFFSAANGNYLNGTGTALSVKSLGDAITAMLTQRDDENNDLDLHPATLLVPPELQTTARSVLESEFITSEPGQPTGNSVKKAVALEVEPRLSNTAKFGSAASDLHWYLFARRSATPLVVAFLNGKQTPTVEFFGLDQSVNKLAVSWHVYFDYGASLIDPRAAVRANGE